MRIETITLRNFRGVQEATVEFAPGVTIVAGPNEAGKSSIAEAIRALRSTKHSSKARAVLALQPVGKDVGPEVELEFTSGKARVWVRKRWLREPLTELRISGPRNEQHSGDTAHERLNTFLAEAMDVELFDALEVVQGHSLATPELVGLRSLSQALDTSSAPVADHDDLIARIEAEYSEHFTAAGRPRGRYLQAGKRVQELTEEHERLRESSREMDQFTADTHREADQLTTDEADLHRAKQNLTECQSRDEALTELREAAAGAHLAAQNAAARVRDARGAADARTGLVADAARRSGSLTEASAEAAARTEELTALRAAAQDLTDARDRARSHRDEARMLLAETSAAVATAVDRQALKQVQDRLERAVAAEEQRIQAAQIVASAHVTGELLEDITARQTDLQVARSAREAAAARVIIRPEGTTPITAGGAQVEAETEVLVTDPVLVAAPGVLTVEVRPGALPEDLNRRVREAEDALAASLAAGQVDSVTGARQVAARRAEAEASRALAEQAFAAALGTESLEELKDEQAALLARLGERAEDPAEGFDLAALRRAAAEAAEQAEAAESQLTEAQGQLDAHAEKVTALREAAIRAESARDNHSEELRRVQTALAAAREEVSDDDLQSEVLAAQEALDQAQHAEVTARSDLEAANPGAVEMELTNAAEWMTSARERVEATRARLNAVKALLEDRAKLGIYDELKSVEAQLESAEREYASLHRRAEAVRVLKEVMLRHRDAAHARYVRPFAEEIQRLGRVVFGPDFAVEITPDLTIASRTLADQTVPFESLSAGAREQLGLLGRLACAALVDPREGAPLILDDTLGFADDDRLRSLGAVLNDVGKSAQIIILTCQPSRFSQVGGASVVHLPSA